MTTTPTYIGMTHIAHALGYTPSNIPHLLAKWENDPDLPTPPPDAYFLNKRGKRTPLWLQERLPEWKHWDQQRITLSHQRQQNANIPLGRPAGPRKQRKQPPTTQP